MVGPPRKAGFLKLHGVPVGASVDGYLGDFEGLVEVKCPKSATHLKYLLADGAPKEYLPQITHQLWVSGAAWCDFVSYDRRFPPALQLLIVRVQRRDVDIAAHALAIGAFLAEVDRDVSVCRKRCDGSDDPALPMPLPLFVPQ